MAVWRKFILLNKENILQRNPLLRCYARTIRDFPQAIVEI